MNGSNVLLCEGWCLWMLSWCEKDSYSIKVLSCCCEKEYLCWSVGKDSGLIQGCKLQVFESNVELPNVCIHILLPIQVVRDVQTCEERHSYLVILQVMSNVSVNIYS